MRNLSGIDWVALILVIIGGLNWGLVGLAQFNLVEAIFGMGMFARVIYVLVGLSALYAIFLSTALSKKSMLERKAI